MDAKPRDPLPPDARTLPARYYVDPDHFLAERERFFGRMWVCVGREDEVPEPGDAILREVAGESLIVVRGDDGEVRAFYNVCRHRGTRLLTEPESCVGKRIQCPYHAWTYDLRRPARRRPPHGRGPPVPQGRLPAQAGRACDRWDGHLFVHLADDPAPLEDQLGDLAEKFRPWGMGDAPPGPPDRLRRGGELEADPPELLRVPALPDHPPGPAAALALPERRERAGHRPPTSAAGWTSATGSRPWRWAASRRWRPCPASAEADRRHVYFYALLPNLMLSLHPDYVMTHLLRPVACDRTEIVCDFHVHPDELARPGFDLADVVEFWDLTNRQDWHVSELTQLGLNSRAYSPGPYSDREDLLYAFDRIVAGGSEPEG